MYFTVDMNTVGYRSGEEHYYSGYSRQIIAGGKQYVYMIMSDRVDGMTDIVNTNRIVISEFNDCIDSIHERYGGRVARKLIIRQLKSLLSDWNRRMFESSCKGNILSASVTILVIMGDRYLSVQTGDSIMIGNAGRRILKTGNSVLGRHSECVLTVHSGRIRCGDSILICSRDYYDEVSLWYVKTLLGRCCCYRRLGRRDIDGKGILESVQDIINRRKNVACLTIAVVCCNSYKRRSIWGRH